LAAGKFVADQAVGCVVWQAAYCAICPWYREMLVGFGRRVVGGVGGVVGRLAPPPAAAR
jgi:hypothetical protein